MRNPGPLGRPANPLYELIPPHRRRAFLRKAFDRLVEIISRPAITAGEVLHALQAYERVVSMGTNTATEQLAKQILEPDTLPDDAFWKDLAGIVWTKFQVKIPIPGEHN
jgi:hypothetical protein